MGDRSLTLRGLGRVALAIALLLSVPGTGKAGDEPAPAWPAHWRSHVLRDAVFDDDIFLVRAGSPANPAVILIHGLGQAGFTDWLTVIPALERDFYVIALDLPGFGRSGAPPGTYSPTNYARVVDGLRQQLGIERAHIVGHSMGGAVALRYAGLFPGRTDTLVLVDAAGILARTAFVKHSATALIESQDLPASLAGPATDYAGRALEWLGGLPDPSQGLEQYEALWVGTLGGQANAKAALALVNEDFSAAVYASTGLVRIIWGAEDAVAPLRTGLMLAGGLRGGSLAVIDGAGHVPMKSHSRQFNRLLLAALGRGDSGDFQRIGPPVTEVASQQVADGSCYGQDGRVYTGTYRSFALHDCQGAVLRDLYAQQLLIRDSSVVLQNVRVQSPLLAVLAERSTVVATNLHLRGVIGLLLSDSRLDLAGVVIDAAVSGAEVVYPSHVVFSISQLRSPGHAGAVHGQYSLGPGRLESALVAP